MAALNGKSLGDMLWRGSVMAAFRTCFIALAIIAVGMLIMWQPWVPKVPGSGRTISVTGMATLRATPDEYVFSPSYQFNNSDKKAALADLTSKSDQIVTKLKSLGVASKDIKTNANGYGDYGYYLPIYDGNNYTLSVTVTVSEASLAQKVQDYLVTTDPTGEITPSVSFSTAKQHELQNQARTKAEQDARAQADQSAANLGFTVGAVKSVTDDNSGGSFPIAYGGLAMGANLDTSNKSLTLQPGQNDLSYSVTVVYYIQ